MQCSSPSCRACSTCATRFARSRTRRTAETAYGNWAWLSTLTTSRSSNLKHTINECEPKIPRTTHDGDPLFRQRLVLRLRSEWQDQEREQEDEAHRHASRPHRLHPGEPVPEERRQSRLRQRPGRRQKPPYVVAEARARRAQ